MFIIYHTCFNTMKKLSNNEIKKYELQILLYFKEFCNLHGIKFYLAGGTLLGAIRHKGFIPWDDDIDVCMARVDYEKLMDIWVDTDRYKLCSDSLNNFSAPFAKIKDMDIKIRSLYSNDDVNTNIWIDIFPVDGLPEEISLVKKIYEKENFYRRLLLLCNARVGEGKSRFRKYCKYLLKPIVNVLGSKWYCRKMNNIAASYRYEDYDYVGAITGGLYGVGERMLKSEFEKSVEVEFEGYKFSTFSCWDSYLKGLYGDYMQLPPIEKRQTHDMTAYLLEDDDKR